MYFKYLLSVIEYFYLCAKVNNFLLLFVLHPETRGDQLKIDLKFMNEFHLEVEKSSESDK